MQVGTRVTCTSPTGLVETGTVRSVWTSGRGVDVDLDDGTVYGYPLTHVSDDARAALADEAFAMLEELVNADLLDPEDAFYQDAERLLARRAALR